MTMSHVLSRNLEIAHVGYVDFGTKAVFLAELSTAPSVSLKSSPSAAQAWSRAADSVVFFTVAFVSFSHASNES